jgi:predicted membrane-bound spermidine synthase
MGLLPFIAGGATLSLMFDAYRIDSNRLYFADLGGAALGTLVVPLIVSGLGVETAILATAILPSIAAMLLSFRLHHRAKHLWMSLSVIVLVAAVTITVWNSHTQTLIIRDAPSKGLYQLLRSSPGSRMISDRWNAYSRISSVSGYDERHLARLFIDSDAWTDILRWDGLPNGLPNAMEWFRAFPFRLAKEPRVLVIGPGGGTDMVLAICAGSSKVTAVEMNPLIVDGVRVWGEKAGNLYDHPKVTLIMDEGRNFIERTSERFDLIVLGFVDSWASVTSGGLSLTENYLYTRDALAAYYDHLTEDGAVAIIRWPTDVPRLVANSVSFLTKRGMHIQEIGEHLLAVSERKPKGSEPVETVFILSKVPISRGTADRLLTGHSESHAIWVPGRESESVYKDLFEGKRSFERYTQSFDTLATPVYDDRPFYFAADKPYGIPSFLVRLFRLPMIMVLVFTLLLLAGSRFLGFQAPGPKTVAYFTTLGVGFIICEVALIQRLILLLGHPIYALVVILFTILLSGALGSWYAKRFDPEAISRVLGWILPVVILLMLLAAFALPLLVRMALPLNLPVRILITGVAIFPFGFFMGMPFPLGLRKAATGGPRGGDTPASVLWGINGVASVVGSIGGVALAVAAGFTWVFLAGACCYALAWMTRPTD